MQFRDTSPFCVRAPCATFPSTKLQFANGFEVVFRWGLVQGVPPRLDKLALAQPTADNEQRPAGDVRPSSHVERYWRNRCNGAEETELVLASFRAIQDP